MPRDWWEDHREIATLLDWLIEQGDISTAAHAQAVVDEPWKFTPEHKAMLAAHNAEAQAA